MSFRNTFLSGTQVILLQEAHGLQWPNIVIKDLYTGHVLTISSFKIVLAGAQCTIIVISFEVFPHNWVSILFLLTAWHLRIKCLKPGPWFLTKDCVQIISGALGWCGLKNISGDGFACNPFPPPSSPNCPSTPSLLPRLLINLLCGEVAQSNLKVSMQNCRLRIPFIFGIINI